MLKKNSQDLKNKNSNRNKTYKANQKQKKALEATANKVKLMLWLK